MVSDGDGLTVFVVAGQARPNAATPNISLRITSPLDPLCQEGELGRATLGPWDLSHVLGSACEERAS